MNKSSYKSQNNRSRAAGKGYRRWKSKSKPKDAKSIMQAEVKSYKERNQVVQDQDGKSVTRNRLTIHQGIYGHGSSSGTVCREIGFTKEGKARAEANLSRIIDLARHGSAVDQSNTVVTRSVTLQRSFVIKDSSDQHENKDSPQTESNGGNEDSPKNDMSSPVASQPSVHHSLSQGSNSKKTSSVPEGSESHANMGKNSGSKCKNPAQPIKISGDETEESVSTAKKSESDDEDDQCEILTAAIMKSLDETTKEIGKVKKLRAGSVKKMLSIWNNASEKGNQTQTPNAISTAFQKQGESWSEASCKDKHNPNNKQQKTDDVILRTPTSRDYLQAKCYSKSRRLRQISNVTSSKGYSVLDVTLHPEKTIISPIALLRQYENKLESLNTNQVVNKQSNTLIANCSESRKITESNTCRRTHGRDEQDLRLQTAFAHCDQKHRVVTPKYQNPMESTSLKTVVVNPLNFLQRCELQSNEQVGKNTALHACRSTDYYFEGLSGEAEIGQVQRLRSNAGVSQGRGNWENEGMKKCSLQERIGRESSAVRNDQVQSVPTSRQYFADVDKISSKEKYCETHNVRDCPIDASRSSHPACRSLISDAKMSTFPYSMPDHPFSKFNANDKSPHTSVCTHPPVHNAFHHGPSQTQDIYNLYKPAVPPNVHPGRDESFSNTSQPKRTLLSPVPENIIQGSRIPFCVQNVPSCSSEGIWLSQMDHHPMNMDMNRQPSLRGASCHIPGSSFSSMQQCCCPDEASSQGNSSLASNSQELMRHHWPDNLSSGKEKSSVCTMDWVDGRRPAACPSHDNDYKQIPKRLGRNSPELHVENYPSPERWFYRRKLY